MIKMNQILSNSSVQAENLEAQMSASSSYVPHSLTLISGKVYDVDARDYLLDGRAVMPKENFLFDYDAIQKQGKSIIGASGKEIKPREDIISSRYLGMVDTFDRAQTELEGSFIPYTSVLGAAGSVTAYETVRRAEDLTDVVGQQYTLEDYTALNAVNIRNVSKVRFTRPRKTSSLNTVQREIGDDVEPEPVRITLTEGTVDIFADAVATTKSMRDEIDTTVSPSGELNKEIAGMLAKEKDDKVTEEINNESGTNQGDWSAVGSGVYTVSAPDQVQVHEDAVKGYGRPLVALFADDAWKGYFRNIQGVEMGKHVSSTSTDMGGVKLPMNPNVTAWVNSSLTAGTYAVISKPSYIDLFKAMTIQTSFKNVRTPGQTEHRYWFDFNGILKNTSSAIGKGTSVLA